MKFRKKHKLTVLKALLAPMSNYFCIVALALIVINWVIAWFTGEGWVLYSQDLGRVLITAFVAVFPHMMMGIFVETTSAKDVLITHIALFIITALLVFGVLMLLDSNIDLRTIITFFLAYASILAFTFKNAIIIDLRDKKLAGDINQQLDEIHKGENESHLG